MAASADGSGSLLDRGQEALSLTINRLRQRGGLSQALIVNLAGAIGLQLMLLVSGVALARALGPTDRGNMALLTMISAIAWQLGGLGIPYAITFASARMPGASRRILDSLRRTIAFQAVAAAVVGGALLIPLTWNRPDPVRLAVALITLTIVALVYQRCALALLQGLRLFVSFNFLRVASNILFSTIALILWIAGNSDFFPYAAAWALTNVAVTPATLWWANRAADAKESGQGEAPSRRSLLVFGRKSLFGGAPPVETYRLDQATVSIFLAPIALGFYVSALSFVSFPRFISQSFATVATPAVARQPTHRDAVRTMWRFCWLALPCYLSVIVVIFIAAPFLVNLFFGAEFARSAGLTRLVLISTALYCARRVLADSSRGAGYPAIGSIAEFVALIAVIPLFAIAVPLWGLNGVAYALIGSSAIALAILVGGVLRSTASGEIPSAWAEIHEEPVNELEVEASETAADFRR
jgi:O-antigen/teichoic acid export membrane protein